MSDNAQPQGENNTNSGLIGSLTDLHRRFFSALERLIGSWFTGLAARLVFVSVLLLYYLNSAFGKLGEGFFGFLNLDSGAYVTILPKLMEQVSYDESALAFFPWHVIVYLGTWTEIILPILILIGLFSRLASLAMIGFVIVQSYVDVTGHGLDDKSIGAMFDRLPDAVIWDQRLLWIFVLAMIVVHGPGKFSVDHLLARSGR